MENYPVIAYWSEQDGCFLAEVPYLPGCMANGATEAEARQNALESAQRWIKMAQYLGREVPTFSPGAEVPEALIETKVLSNRDRDAFLALLDADPEPTEAAKKAAAEYNQSWSMDGVYHFRLPACDPETDDLSDYNQRK